MIFRMRILGESLLLAGSALLLGAGTGCMGTQSFGIAARSGDTIALAVGRYDNLQKSNMTVTVTDSSGKVTTYQPNSSAIRAVINLYPDPASYLMYSDRLYPGLPGLLSILNSTTSGDKDWWETTVYLNLPSGMATGTANVSITTAIGQTIGPIAVTILPGTGSANVFWASYSTGPVGLGSSLFMAERLPHATIIFDGATVPYGVQIRLTHANSIDSGTGSNLALAVLPRGDQSTLIWDDDGTTLRVLMQSPSEMLPEKTKNYKFYLLGVDPASLQILSGSLKAVDANGNPISGISASIQ